MSININKKAVLIIISFFLCISSLFGQNYFDKKHTKKFADYLFQTQQYSFAADEYERLHYQDSNIQNKVSLIKSYRLAKMHQKGLTRLHDFYHMKKNIPYPLSEEYIKLCLYDNKTLHLTDLNLLSLPAVKKNYYEVCLFLLDKEWNRAYFSLKNQNGEFCDGNLEEIVEKGQTLKYKKPLLAAGLSTILPGAGKIYAGRWQDGIIALLFVAGNAWQSFRGFENNGLDSAYGWIFGSISFGFYLGNIFGSQKAAKRYNQLVNNQLHHEAKNYIFSRF
jgi:hypothetical protein